MTDPLNLAAIMDGHRRLLQGWRELSVEWDAVVQDGEAAVLRACRGFLRHECIPFASWEERRLVEAPEVEEAVAFEHAFLFAEVDAFLEETRAVGGSSGAGEDRAATTFRRRLRRRFDRIEAILELHALRIEDRGIHVEGYDPGSVGPDERVRPRDPAGS